MPTPINTRQKMITPIIETEGEPAVKACASVAKMMRINSRPIHKLSEAIHLGRSVTHTIHPLTTYDISHSTKEQLTYNRSSRGRQLDSVVRAGGKLSLLRIVHDTQHDGQHADTEDIV